MEKGDNLRFCFKIHPTKNFQRLPLVKDISPISESYPETFNLTLNVTGYNNKPVRAGWSYDQYGHKTQCCNTFTPHDNVYTGTISCTVTFGDRDSTALYFDALEIGGYLGWQTENPLTRYKVGTIRPKLNLTTRPNDSYSATDTIYIEGEVNDEHYVI